MPGKRYWLSAENPTNARLGEYPASRVTGFPRISAPDAAWKDPVYAHGNHPEAVAWVWDRLGSALPVDCRCLLYGTPALMAPVSGCALAVAWGTSYILRVPPTIASIVAKSQASMILSLVQKGFVDVTRQFGEEWVYGAASNEDLAWCRSAFDSVESRVQE